MRREIQHRRVMPVAGFMLLLLIFIPESAQAAQADAIKTITLNQAIEMARANNPDLKQVFNQLRLSEIDANQKKANFLPEISLSLQASQQYDKTLDNETGLYSAESNKGFSLSGTISLNLFNGFYDRFSLRQSTYELEASRETLTRYQQGIVFETIQRFIQVVLSGELILVDKQNLEAQRLQLDRIRDFFESGRRPVADLLQQKAEISKYELKLLTSERNHEVNLLRLIEILGLEPFVPYRISDPDIECLIENVKAINPENILEKALARRPDILSQYNQIQSAKMGILAARAGYWPKVSLNLSAGTSYNSGVPGGGFSDQFLDYNPGASIGLTLSVPVFDRNQTRNSVARAKINLNNQQLEMEKLRYQINLEVKQAAEDFRTANKQVVAADAQEKYSREALDSVQQRYDVDAATMTELIQARSQHYTSLYDLVEAKFNLLIQGISLAYYQGDGEGMVALLETRNITN